MSYIKFEWCERDEDQEVFEKFLDLLRSASIRPPGFFYTPSIINLGERLLYVNKSSNPMCNLKASTQPVMSFWHICTPHKCHNKLLEHKRSNEKMIFAPNLYYRMIWSLYDYTGGIRPTEGPFTICSRCYHAFSPLVVKKTKMFAFKDKVHGPN